MAQFKVGDRVYIQLSQNVARPATVARVADGCVYHYPDGCNRDEGEHCSGIERVMHAHLVEQPPSSFLKAHGGGFAWVDPVDESLRRQRDANLRKVFG